MTVPTPVIDPLSQQGVYCLQSKAEFTEFIRGTLYNLTNPAIWHEVGATVEETVDAALQVFLSFQRCDVLKIGDVVMHAGPNLPADRLWCDGTEYDISQYPELAQVLGSNAVRGEGRFVVPDMRSTFPLGGTYVDGVGDDVTAMGGRWYASLSDQGMNATHNHLAHDHVTVLVVGPGEIPVAGPAYPEWTSQSGNNMEFDIEPPYTVLNFCIVYRGVLP